MDELRIDEELLHKCIQQVTVGDYQHRGIKGLLEMIAMAGYRWRNPCENCSLQFKPRQRG